MDQFRTQEDNEQAQALTLGVAGILAISILSYWLLYYCAIVTPNMLIMTTVLSIALSITPLERKTILTAFTCSLATCILIELLFDMSYEYMYERHISEVKSALTLPPSMSTFISALHNKGLDIYNAPIAYNIDLLGRFIVWFLFSAPSLCIALLIAFAVSFLPNRLQKDYTKGAHKKHKEQNKNNTVPFWAVMWMNKKPASKQNQTIIGATYFGKKVTISDNEANKHTLVVGPTGSGKTVTICNMVESFIDRGLPIIFVDGKGDKNLGQKICIYARERGRLDFEVSCDGLSKHTYDPFFVGGYTSIKDRIIESLDWSETYYLNVANSYLQTEIKILKQCEVPITFKNLLQYFDKEAMIALIREHEYILKDPQILLNELSENTYEAKSLNGLKLGLKNFAESEASRALDYNPRGMPLRLQQAIERNAIAYISLRPMEFPKHARAFGRLLINDIKATVAKLPTHNSKKFLLVFDEFSAFAGEEIAELITQARAHGACVVTGTQSISDFEYASDTHGKAFAEKMMSNHANIIVHAQPTPEASDYFSKAGGTRTNYIPTVQINEKEPSGMGSVRQGEEFNIDPNHLRNLKVGEAFILKRMGKSKPIFTKIRKSKIQD